MVTFALVDVDGTSHALNRAAGISVRMGVEGSGGPVITPNEDKLAYAPGTQLRRVSTGPTKLTVPLLIEGASSAAIEGLLDDLREWVFPGTEYQDEPSKCGFRVNRDDGTTRQIDGIYVEGLGGNDALGRLSAHHRLNLVLHADDPYWSDIADTVVTFTTGAGLPLWFPYYPYYLSPSSVLSEQTVTNSGQLEAWPIWVISGPGSGPIITNVDTGEYFTFGVTLGTGETITVDTRPRRKTAVRSDGTEVSGLMSSASVFWPLTKGANTVRVVFSSTTSDSYVTCNYRRRWIGGHR